MKKARIFLSIIALLAVVGGAFAFKAFRFNANPAWRYTTAITIGGSVYASTVSFCTSTQAVSFFTTECFEITTTCISTPWVGGPSTITLRNTANTSLTYTIPEASCIVVTSCVTAIL
ncbi:hypothetical protein [Chitinophaga ginsengisoli]|uniref:hypothetical protein n=1 Tax=Chitinophaga ginsengisoli TaxID=363837 RepID=UPI0011B1F25F|nr:hypothetical protein [Chitinophaga ginsengisoli]